MTSNKPVAYSRNPVLDYNECSEFLQSKYGYNETDVLGHFFSAQKERYMKDFPEDLQPPHVGAVTKEGRSFPWKLSYAKQNPDKCKPEEIGRYHIDGIECTEEEALAAEKISGSWYERFHEWEQTHLAPPYCNFWHWVCDHYGIHNGSDLTFEADGIDNIKEEWARKIYQYFIDEFADERGRVEMHAAW